MDDDLFGPMLDNDESEIEEAVRGLNALLQEPTEGATPHGAAEEPHEMAQVSEASPSTAAEETIQVKFWAGMSCPACPEASHPFQRYDSLVRHWKEIHPPSIKVFPCPEEGCRHHTKR